MIIIQDIIINLLKTTIISSILILFILILKATWFKKYDKNLNYYIWLFVIARLIIPIEIPIRYTFSENSIHIYTYFYIFIFYLIGVTILSIYSIITYLKYRNLIKKLSYDIDDNIEFIFNEIKKEMNINKNIEVRYCDYIKSPCLIIC